MSGGFALFVAVFAGCGARASKGGVKGADAYRGADPQALVEQFAEALVDIENDYVEPVERRRLLKGAVRGMLEELDPHSSYMDAAEFAAFREDSRGQFAGVGLEVDFRSGELVVLAPIEGSPADRAGIRPGDRILAVDGRPVEGGALERLVKAMRGAPGTRVRLTVKREGAKEPLVVPLVREVVTVASVDGKRLEGHVVYIRVKQFQENTHDELLRECARLRAGDRDGIGGVLLDLRNNPGGIVDEAAEVADEFLAAGLIYSTRHRGELIDEVRARDGGVLSSVPVVVLINEWSASAAELVAGALKDNGRASLVGRTTFGKGSVQSVLPLPHGGGLRLTTALYFLPGGQAVQARGVEPDVIVETKDGETFSYSERELERHLDAVGRPEGRMREPVRVRAGGVDRPSRVNDIPPDPTSSDDGILRVGYGLLRSRQTQKR